MRGRRPLARPEREPDGDEERREDRDDGRERDDRARDPHPELEVADVDLDEVEGEALDEVVLDRVEAPERDGVDLAGPRGLCWSKRKKLPILKLPISAESKFFFLIFGRAILVRRELEDGLKKPWPNSARRVELKIH